MLSNLANNPVCFVASDPNCQFFDGDEKLITRLHVRLCARLSQRSRNIIPTTSPHFSREKLFFPITRILQEQRTNPHACVCRKLGTRQCKTIWYFMWRVCFNTHDHEASTHTHTHGCHPYTEDNYHIIPSVNQRTHHGNYQSSNASSWHRPSHLPGSACCIAQPEVCGVEKDGHQAARQFR